MSNGRSIKQYPSPDEEEQVSFYLERQQFMDPNKRYSVPVNINGYEYEAVFGERQKLPRSVVNALKDAKSMVSGKAGGMSTPHDVDRVSGGSGRNQSELHQRKQEYQYINDYHVIEE
jgi:hypothetical protein